MTENARGIQTQFIREIAFSKGVWFILCGGRQHFYKYYSCTRKITNYFH